MDETQFLEILEETKRDLLEIANDSGFKNASDFEQAVRDSIGRKYQNFGGILDSNPHPHAFPEISLGRFGVEVKFSEKDSWRNVANSISEGVRDRSVKQILLFTAKWVGSRYLHVFTKMLMHVRTSHVPRFELDMETVDNIFEQFEDVSRICFNEHDKMKFVRRYALITQRGERLWWLDGGEASLLRPNTSVPLYDPVSSGKK